MKRFFILFHLAILCFAAKAQQINCSPENKEAVLAKIKEIGSLNAPSYGAYLVAIGKTFIGTPYVAKTLEIGPQEQLVITLEGLDCTTFVENVLAFGLLKKEAHPDFESFLRHWKPSGTGMENLMVMAPGYTISPNGFQIMKKKDCCKTVLKTWEASR